MKKKVFISCPMRGRSNEEILKERERCLKKAEAILNCEVEEVDSFFQDEVDQDMLEKTAQLPVYFLGKALKKMSEADVIFVAMHDYENRGCAIELHVAQLYGMETIEEYEESYIYRVGKTDDEIEQTKAANGAVAEAIPKN